MEDISSFNLKRIKSNEIMNKVRKKMKTKWHADGKKEAKSVKKKQREKGRDTELRKNISGAWNLINHSSTCKSIKTSSQICDLWPLYVGVKLNQN